MTDRSSEYATRFLLFGGLILGGFLAFFAARILLVPFVAALFLVYVFEPAVIQLRRKHLSASTAFVLLLAVTVLGVGTFLTFIPSWLSVDDPGEFRSVIAASPEGADSEFTARLETQLREVEQWIKDRLPVVASFDIAGEVTNRGTSFVVRFFNGLPSVVGSLMINLLLVPLIAYFMVRDGRKLRRRLVGMVPNRYFEMSLMMMHQVDTQVGGYFRSRFIESILVGLSMLVAMGVLAIWVPQPFILLIAVIIGLTNLIPYIGPVMGLAFGALLYLGLGFPVSSIVGLAAGVGIAQLLDNVVFAPIVLSQNVDLHPLTVILVLLIGGEILGVLGLLIAVPVAASVKIISAELYRNYSLQVR
jgi:putative permease